MGCITPKETPAPTPMPTTPKPPTVAPTTTPPPKPVVYEGTLYISSMGGYFVKTPVKIDPTKETPIEVGTQERILLHPNITVSKKIYATHDARIDHARNIMFWSVYFEDKDPVTNKSYVHVGKIDLATNKVVADVKIDKDPKVWVPIQYCASGQTKDKYLVVMMGSESYILILDKDTLKEERRVYLNIPGIPQNYLWPHGTNSPDMKEFALVMTLSDKQGIFPRGSTTEQKFYILDMESLLKGEIKILREKTITSDPKMSAFFRQYFTPDGKYLLQSNRDRALILDAKTLEVKAEIMAPAVGYENHDFFTTGDGKYGILTWRVPVELEPGKKTMDGRIQLVDIEKGKYVGEPVSVCNACHLKGVADWITKGKTAVTCGLDGIWKK